MDLLSQHEAFLRAIFDAPADDTPRLVYADFLQENGEEDRAEFIRVSVELSQRYPKIPGEEELPAYAALCGRRDELFGRLSAVRPQQFPPGARFVRGFLPPHRSIWIGTAELATPDGLRERMVSGSNCFGVTEVTLKGPRLLTGHAFDVLFGLPALAKMTHLDLSGEQQPVRGVEDGPDGLQMAGFEYVLAPVVSVLAVEALARHRGVRRITSLDLRNNNLDNDAARALVKSPYLDNLKRLDLLEGNRFRGKVWQQVIERFGEDVVG
ncbi:MAG: TIGR02996 domain-containing protein [Planctomycetes bacterium]|nr:TIGR02996 domain-containing protein [Planctomycetota bacterium]